MSKLGAFVHAARVRLGIAGLKKPYATVDGQHQHAPPAGEPSAARRGDEVYVLREREPHISFDVLTPMQIATLFKSQEDYRTLHHEPPATLDEARALIAFVERVQILSRILQLTLAGHLAVDLRDSQQGFKFLRRWGADEIQALALGDEPLEPKPGPAVKLVGPDGEPTP